MAPTQGFTDYSSEIRKIGGRWIAAMGRLGPFLLFLFGTPALAEEGPELQDIKGFKAMVLQLAAGDRMMPFASIERVEVEVDTGHVDNRDAQAELAALITTAAEEELELRLEQVTLGRISVGSRMDRPTTSVDICKILTLSFSVTLYERPRPNSKETIPIGALVMDTRRLEREDGRSKGCDGAKTKAIGGMSMMQLFASADLTPQHALEAMKPGIRTSILNLVAVMAADDGQAVAEIRKWDD